VANFVRSIFHVDVAATASAGVFKHNKLEATVGEQKVIGGRRSQAQTHLSKKQAFNDLPHPRFGWRIV